MDWAVVVGAYVTGRAKPSDTFRYSIMVLNRNNNVGAGQPPSISDDPLQRKTSEFQRHIPIGHSQTLSTSAGNIHIPCRSNNALLVFRNGNGFNGQGRGCHVCKIRGRPAKPLFQQS
ncbi:hypothetical protein K443DRAFT_385469 [Laccaria amethystina LaAM-08-1]|uniref:Uncharacterized protein n=1 Tax=Laccaria amethystina LaAM-08-1 TaxID=1095629 RepID=A0A0C9XWL7_9AGAR|nr:hypothetical protein K443DRAFT_385469 [Laccaria amethystina LaAM-08-1]